VQSLGAFNHIDVRIEVDGESIETKAVFVSVANARYLAGGFRFAPMASIQDGLLDLAIIGDLSLPDFLRNVPRVYRGTHLSHRKFTHIPTTRVRVESSDHALVQLDGEVAGTAPVEFTVRPLALDVIANLSTAT
jgi:diacylglycerol kinase (ATP)